MPKNLQDRVDEIHHRILMQRIGVDPACMHLGLPHGLQHVLLYPGPEHGKLVLLRLAKGPGSRQCLVEQVLLIAARGGFAVNNHLEFAVLAAPARKPLPPLVRDL